MAFLAAYKLGWAKCVSAEHTLSKRPIANGGAAVNTLTNITMKIILFYKVIIFMNLTYAVENLPRCINQWTTFQREFDRTSRNKWRTIVRLHIDRYFYKTSIK